MSAAWFWKQEGLNDLADRDQFNTITRRINGGLNGLDDRLALEQRLAAGEQTHFRKMTDAQREQDRLRDRLATSDLRLSVLLDATDAAKGCGVPTTVGAGGVNHAAVRARLTVLSVAPVCIP
jgi:hypothetical protein